jgi:hypothetical protein
VKDIDDLSDVVPSEKFLAEFPDGKIPIRDVTRVSKHLVYTDDIIEALSRMVSEHDQTAAILKSMTATEVFEKIDQYAAIDRRNFKDRKAILSDLLSQGLSIRTLVKLMPHANPTRIIGLLTASKDSSSFTDEAMESIYVADEMIMAGTERCKILEATGIHQNTLKALERVRVPSDIGYEGAMKHAFFMMMNGESVADAHRSILVNFHDVASTITYHTVYALFRKSRRDRNIKRFGWKPTVGAV